MHIFAMFEELTDAYSAKCPTAKHALVGLVGNVRTVVAVSHKGMQFSQAVGNFDEQFASIDDGKVLDFGSHTLAHGEEIDYFVGISNDIF